MVKSVAYTSPEWMYNHTQTQAQARTHLDIMKDIVAHRAVHVRTAAGAAGRPRPEIRTACQRAKQKVPISAYTERLI